MQGFHRRTVRHEPMRFMVALMLGAMTMPAVAILCAWKGPIGVSVRPGVQATIALDDHRIHVSRERGAGYVRVSWFPIVHAPLRSKEPDQDAAQALPSWSTARQPAHADRVRGLQTHPGAFPTQEDVAVGWPFLAFHAHRAATPFALPGPSIPPKPRWTNAFHLPEAKVTQPDGSRLTVRPVMPYAPLWKGVVANTAIFAASWWVVLAGVGQVPSWIRAGKGLCPACGYDLRTQADAGCPECGHGRLKT